MAGSLPPVTDTAQINWTDEDTSSISQGVGLGCRERGLRSMVQWMQFAAGKFHDNGLTLRLHFFHFKMYVKRMLTEKHKPSFCYRTLHLYCSSSKCVFVQLSVEIVKTIPCAQSFMVCLNLKSVVLV